MLYIINAETNAILKKFDAWSETCMSDAKTYVKSNNYKVVDEFISELGGDLYWFVK